MCGLQKRLFLCRIEQTVWVLVSTFINVIRKMWVTSNSPESYSTSLSRRHIVANRTSVTMLGPI